MLFWSAQSFAAPYQITDSFGKHWFEEVPKRIVVTDWTVLENLLILGTLPVGAPELDAYREQVVTPALSNSTADIGLRVAPSLGKIKALNPDLIILGTGQKDLARPLSRIAKVIYYKSFSPRYRGNGEKATKRFLQMADLLQKRPEAEQLLAQQSTKLATLKQQTRSQTVTLLLLHQNQLKAFGENSLPGYTAKQLGLNLGANPPLSWQAETLDSDADLNEQTLILWQTGSALSRQQIEQRWPALSKAKVLSLPSWVWPYGGALSIQRLATSIHGALNPQ